MRTATLLLVSLLGSSVALAGCDGAKKDDKKGEGKKGDAKEGDAKEGDAKEGDAKEGGDAAAAAGDIDLPKTGLKGTAPADSKVSDMMGSDMVQGPGLVVTVANVEGDAWTIEKAKEDIDMYSPENIVEEKLDDGFALTYTNKGGAGTNYWVKVMRTFDGKQVDCTTTAPDEDHQKSALAFCKTLKK